MGVQQLFDPLQLTAQTFNLYLNFGETHAFATL